MEEKITVTPKQVGANIRRLRLLHGETQKQLAEITNLGDSTIANYEKGYRMPDLITFFKIALHYQASLEYFTHCEVPNKETVL